MAKGIIVVDVPERCVDCKFRNLFRDMVTGEFIRECEIVDESVIMNENEKPDWCPIKPVPLALACNKLIEELNKKEDFYNAFRAGIINSIKDPDTMSYPEPEDIADKIIKRITGD
ncbi:hypothetical protein B5F53_11510 [Blautia sp. An249]|uniref:hypothetical protein n=1 Tax=Blautia sp. An249 TaxID=1965603 RepID=UPI000B39A5DC|nr:hypothetical protein [Blautia sp. An249]OUO78168.1 hypothetical protein B5F53_11510 [Blautia sp. An249]